MLTVKLSRSQLQRLLVLALALSFPMTAKSYGKANPQTERAAHQASQRNKERQEPGTGSLRLSITFDDEESRTSAPLDTLIEIDAKPHRQVKRLGDGRIVLSGIPAGARQLTLSGPSFGTVNEEVEIQPGQTTYFHLWVKRSTASLIVSSEIGAQIFVNNRLRDQVGQGGRSGKIELLPGKHTIRVVKDEFETQEFTRDLASGETELPVSLRRIQFSGPFLDQFLGLEAWSHPKDWRIDRGKVVVSGSGLGWRKNELYKDFIFRFQVRFLNGKGAVWQVRGQGEDSYYLFQLELPGTGTDIARFNTYKVENGQTRVAQSPQQVTVDLKGKDRFFWIVVTARGDEIKHQIEDPNRKATDPEYVNLSIFRDQTNPFLWGRVGFGTRNDEQFVVSSPQVEVSHKTPIESKKASSASGRD